MLSAVWALIFVINGNLLGFLLARKHHPMAITTRRTANLVISGIGIVPNAMELGRVSWWDIANMIEKYVAEYWKIEAEQT